MNIKLTNTQRIKLSCSDDVYSIMQRILLRENRIDRNREHLWTISLDNANRLLNIELVSMGTINKTLVEPMEVFSVPLQKRAVKIVIVHNHPSGKTKPSEADKDITDRLIQVGRIMDVPVTDHLIITENTFFSFADSGLLAELELSTKYVPAYVLKTRYEKAAEEKGAEKGKKERSKAIAKSLKAKGIDIDTIAAVTGLTKATINRLKTE